VDNAHILNHADSTIQRPIPASVTTAERSAAEAAFTQSCIPEVGRLLSAAAAELFAGHGAQVYATENH